MALDSRSTNVLIGMCDPNVVIRPYVARQAAGPPEYRGYDGLEQWVGSLDRATRITLDLHEVVVTGQQSAVVETEVWLTTGDERTGGRTWSAWHFEDGKLRAAVGYGTKDDALAAEAAAA